MDHDNLRQHIDAHADIKAGRAIALIWGINDILEMEGPGGDPHGLSESEAIQILRQVEENHDANHGISWDNLEYAIADHLREYPRRILRGDVAIGRAWGGGESGGWDILPVELIAQPLEGLNDSEIALAFEQEAADILDARGEEAVFVKLLAYQEAESDEDKDEDEDEDEGEDEDEDEGVNDLLTAGT